MGKLAATFDGRIVADVEARTVGSSTVYEFPVYVNRVKKDKATGKWEETGDVTKIRVAVWNEAPAVQKGDVVQVTASLYEATWKKSDGSEGRMLQTDYVESIEVKHRRDAGHHTVANNAVNDAWAAPAPTGEAPF
jgi:single-stranded DNA-binding protein